MIGVLVDNSDALLLQARKDADARRAYAEQHGYKNYGGGRVQEGDFIGRIAELNVAERYGMESPSSIGNIHSVDVGDIIEARARDVHARTGLDLLIRAKDKSDVPHVLVLVNLPMKKSQIVGWLLAREAIWLARQNGNCWYNSATQGWYIPFWLLHSVKSLDDWVIAGAPPFRWRPPE
jgi:hypothetical protein